MHLSFFAFCASATEFVVPSADHSSVQSAIGAASDGDVIIVTESLRGQVDVNDKDLVILGLGHSVVLTANAGPVLELRGDSIVSVRHLTIDGEDSRQAVQIREDANATLDAVKVMRGVEEGGGIEVYDDAEALIDGALVCGCDAPSGGDIGGGIWTYGNGVADISGSVFFANDANSRGGAVRFEGPGSIVGTTFYLNTSARAAAISASDSGSSSDVLISDTIFWLNENRFSKKNPPVVDRSNNSSFIGGGNLYFDNDPADTDTVLAGDSFGTDPGLVTGAPTCLTATMADFTAVSGGLAATLGAGAVGIDTDADGYGVGPDCDVNNGLVHPGAAEMIGDQVDQNCDGVELCYVDGDGDGYGDPATTIWTTDLMCVGDGHAPNGDDCDDNEASIYLGAPEAVGDGIDQDCVAGDACFVDQDGDGYTTGVVIPSIDLDCDDGVEAGSGTLSGDCDDTNAQANPGIAVDAIGDGIDANCDGVERCYADVDNDGFSDLNQVVLSPSGTCLGAGEGFATVEDCDDSDINSFPGAPEQCDQRDNDCDSSIDEKVVFTDWYPDVDGDSFGDGSSFVNACKAPPNTVSVAGDCDDTNAAISPGLTELPCDGVDNDCTASTFDDDGTCYQDTGHTGTVPTDTDADTDTDTDTDTDADADADTDADADADTDVDTDAGTTEDPRSMSGVATTGCTCRHPTLGWAFPTALFRRR